MGFFEDDRKKHAHTCAVFFFSVCAVGLLIGALNVDWYVITTQTDVFSSQASNTTTKYDFTGETTVTVLVGSTSTNSEAWKNLNRPNWFKVIQSVQSFTTIATIISGATAAGAILIGCFKCCSSGTRDVLKVLVGIVAIAALAFCILSWAVFLGTPKAWQEDYSQSNNGATCNTGPCTGFKNSATQSLEPLGSVTTTWGPDIGFWLMIGATASSLIAVLEIVREASVASCC